MIALWATWLAVGLAAILPPVPAHADEPESWVQITIGSVSPAIPKSDDTVVITGTVHNTTDIALSKLQAMMWRNQAPITDAEQMSTIVGSASDDPMGSRIADFGSWQWLTQSFDPTTADLPVDLPPGKSMPFRVRARMDQFQFPGTPGVYLIGVHMRGTVDGIGGADLTLGRARVFLPVGVSDAEVRRPTPMCSVVVLSTAPTQLSAGVFADDSLAGQVADGGDLDRLLDLSAQPGYSVLVDPALVASVRALTQPYTVRRSGSTSTSHPASNAAQDWLDRLAAVPRDRMFQLPYANPDVAALVHTGQAGLYRPDLGADILPGVPRVALPASGAADEATVKVAGTGTLQAILLSRQTTGSTAPVLSTPLAPVPIITFDAAALDGGPGPDPRTTPAQIRQRYLADTYLWATGRSPAAVVRLITNVRQAQAVPAVDAPWLKAVPLASLLDQDPQPWSGQLSYPAAARKAELSKASVRSAARLAADYRTYAELQVDQNPTDGSAQAAVARATSVHWRGNSDRAKAYLAPQQDVLDQVLDGGKLRLVQPKKVLLTGDVGETGFTIVNDLDIDVRVSVKFASANSQRLTVKNITNQVIPAHSRAPVTTEFAPQANGEVPVTAQLTTVSGSRIGKNVDFIVSATSYGSVGWAIAVAAGVVLFVSTFLRIRQVRRESAAATDVEADGLVDTRGPRPEPPSVDQPGADRTDSSASAG